MDEDPETAYRQRLLKDIERTELYIRHANSAIEQLDSGDRGGTLVGNEVEKKKEIIARYEAYKTLSYFPDKNDVIGTATASSVTSALVKQQQEAIHRYRAGAREAKADNRRMQLVLSDFEQLDLLLADEIAAKTRDAAVVEDKITQIRSQGGEATQDEVDEIVSKTLSDTKKVYNKYLSHLKYILLEYTSGNPMVSLDECMDLIQRLIYGRLGAGSEGYDGLGWIEVDISKYGNLELVKLLLLNDLIIGRDNYPNVYRLREFGLQ